MSDLRRLGILLPLLISLRTPLIVSALCLILLGLLEPLFAVLMQPFLDETLIAKEAQSLYLYPALIILLFIVKGVVEYLSKVASGYLVTTIVTSLRARIFACALRLPFSEIEDQSTARLLGRLINDVQQIGNVFTHLWGF